MSVIHEAVELGHTELNEEIAKLAKERGYGAENWKLSTVLNHLEKHQNYFELVKNLDGRQIISDEEYKTALTAAHHIASNRYTSKYLEEGDGIEILVQYPIYWTLGNISCKGLIDLLRIDHNTKTIYLIDIKTTGSYLESFTSSIARHRYDLQLSFYKNGLQEVFADTEIYSYDIKCLIIAVSFKEPQYPEVFELSEADLNIAKYGSKEKEIYALNGEKIFYVKLDTPIVGWLDLLVRRATYLDIGHEYLEDYIENNGVHKVSLY